MIANVVKKHCLYKTIGECVYIMNSGNLLVSPVKSNDPGLSNGHVSKMYPNVCN